MKIQILNNGIYNGTRNEIVNTKNDLQSAKSVSIDCPSNLSYSSQIKGIKGEIQGFINKLKDINDGLYTIDNNYRNFISNEAISIRRLDGASVSKRDGVKNI